MSIVLHREVKVKRTKLNLNTMLLSLIASLFPGDQAMHKVYLLSKVDKTTQKQLREKKWIEFKNDWAYLTQKFKDDRTRIIKARRRNIFPPKKLNLQLCSKDLELALEGSNQEGYDLKDPALATKQLFRCAYKCKFNGEPLQDINHQDYRKANRCQTIAGISLKNTMNEEMIIFFSLHNNSRLRTLAMNKVKKLKLSSISSLGNTSKDDSLT